MATNVRFLLVAGTVAALALGGAARASACGSNGYSYAGLNVPHRAFGISATVTSVQAFAVLHGHVAAWVGVGGPHEGPAGANEWLQIGISAFPAMTGNDLYYEVSQPNRYPVYHELPGNLPAGTPVRVGVLEMHGRPDWWRVWLNGRAVSSAIRLRGSDDRWAPMAAAESWDGGTGGACNTFLYRFGGIEVAHARGGGWRTASDGVPFTTSTTRIRRSHGGAAFLAAQGRAALLLLPSLQP